ncbi:MULTISPECIES: hypothetical protein [unclassified Burkholderia]|uniref:hypothetical protein n=1 Tax=unclassified Burkholderia TaxID=2613784 RepID=UPI0014245000|nr:MULTISPECIES: hypothetical protein [unclassified Burkholderia]
MDAAPWHGRQSRRGTKGGGLVLLTLAFAFPAIPMGCAFLAHPVSYRLLTLA